MPLTLQNMNLLVQCIYFHLVKVPLCSPHHTGVSPRMTRHYPPWKPGVLWQCHGRKACQAHRGLRALICHGMACPRAGIPFVIINSLCGALCAYGLAGLRMQAHAVLINLCVVALQSMISIQLQVRSSMPLTNRSTETCSSLLLPSVALLALPVGVLVGSGCGAR